VKQSLCAIYFIGEKIKFVCCTFKVTVSYLQNVTVFFEPSTAYVTSVSEYDRFLCVKLLNVCSL